MSENKAIIRLTKNNAQHLADAAEVLGLSKATIANIIIDDAINKVWDTFPVSDEPDNDDYDEHSSKYLTFGEVFALELFPKMLAQRGIMRRNRQDEQ